MSVSDPDDRNRKMKWMSMAMVVCCAAPITIALSFGVGLGVVFGHETQPISTNKSTNLKANSGSNPSDLSANALSPAVNWQAGNHTHGLAVNPSNPNVIYVATHQGLIQRTETGKWLWMQPKQQRADYMGFTTDPTNSNRFYASGHPQTGGNLGF